MSVSHHPSEALLLDYATGAMGEAWGLAVATHLAFCPACRRAVSDIEALGGVLLDDMPGAAAASRSFETMTSLLDRMAAGERPAAPGAALGRSLALPEPLRGYVDGYGDAIDWRPLGRGAYQKVLLVDGGGVTARLLRVASGRPVPEHSHRGLELTLVLRGAFTDATGGYQPGDLQEADQALMHQPRAAKGEDCVCVLVTDAPLRFSSPFARLVQPFLGV